MEIFMDIEFYNKLNQALHGDAGKIDRVMRFRYLNEFVKPGQILFAGSSLMEQFPIQEFVADFDLPLTIYNRGVGGFTTSEMLACMQDCVYALRPAYIFINIGTNDLNDPACTPDVLRSRYRTILSGTKFREIRNRAFESAADVGCADDEKRQLFIAFV